MGCGLSTESGRRARKNVAARTHDIFIERYPREENPDTRFRAGFENLPEPFPGRRRAAKRTDGRLALVVRRPKATDLAHENRELGHRHDPNANTWTPYPITRSGVEVRGGRLYQEKEPKLKQLVFFGRRGEPQNDGGQPGPGARGDGAHGRGGHNDNDDGDDDGPNP